MSFGGCFGFSDRELTGGRPHQGRLASKRFGLWDGGGMGEPPPSFPQRAVSTQTIGPHWGPRFMRQRGESRRAVRTCGRL